MKKIIISEEVFAVIICGSIFLLHSDNAVCEVIGVIILAVFTVIHVTITFRKEIKA